jgi:predicted amidohydrolase YtcJ
MFQRAARNNHEESRSEGSHAASRFRNPAYIGFEENKKGSLEAGKFADFIVIDRDILAVAPEQLKDVQVLQTWVGGELVYENR